MKTIKNFLLIVSIALSGFTLEAQGLKGEKKKNSTETKPKCFDENTRIINVGVGFGGGNYYKYGSGGSQRYRRSPAFSVTYEQAFKKKLGPGYLGLGAYFGYQNASYRYDDVYYKGERYYYQHSWNHMLIAARGAYHLDFLNSKNAEVYGGAILGVRIQTYNFKTNSPDPDDYDYRLHDGSVYPTYSLFVGARWYFVPKVALFAEAGYGISYITGGFSFKF